MLEQRLENIELKLTSQEDSLDILNQQIYRQQKQIDELTFICTALAKRVRESGGNSDQSGLPHEKPPHY